MQKFIAQASRMPTRKSRATPLVPRATVNDELARRGKVSAYGHLLLLSLACFAALPRMKQFSEVYWAGGLIIVVNFFRIWLLSPRREAARREVAAWEYGYHFATISAAAGWTILGTLAIRRFGIADSLTTLIFLIIAGIASSACTSLSPRAWLARAFESMLLLPVAYALCFACESTFRGEMAVVIVAYYLYLQVQISAQAREFARLKQSEDLFRTLSESTLEGVAIEENGVITEVNLSLARILGVGRAQIIGRTAMSFASDTQATGIDLGNGSFEHHFVRADGSAMTVELTRRPCIFLGHEAHCITLRDVTESRAVEKALRASELRVRALMQNGFDTLPCMLLVANADSIEFCNRKWVEYTGYDLAALSRDRNAPLEVFHPDERDTVAKNWIDAVTAGGSFTMEHRLRARDGSYRWHLSTALPASNGEDGVQWFSALIDIEDQKRAEAERAMVLGRERAALEASRLKSEFLANMSHEIRTPLNGILGTADLLAETSLGDTQRKYVGLLRSSGEALIDIVNDILDFSKIEANKLTIEETEFALRPAIESPVSLMITRARQKDINLQLFVDPALPANVTGDPGRLGQVLVNLISNAIKFTQKGTVVIRATPVDATPDEVTVRVSVRDSGIGMTAQTVQNLFQPFTQADGSTARKYGGTGLGLSISKRLVNLMHGEIGVNSILGEGSEFWFWLKLPVRRGQVFAPARHVAPIDRSVVVVNGDAIERDILEVYLRSWGLNVLSCARAQDVVAHLSANDPAGRPVYSALLIAHADCVGEEDNELRNQMLAKLGLQPGSALRISDPQLEHMSGWGKDFGQVHRPLRQSELFDAVINAIEGRSVAESDAPVTPDESTVDPASTRPRFRILVAEDNSTNQLLALANLDKLGYSAHTVGNGQEALDALSREKFDLVLMDCQMPELDGFAATRLYRERERREGLPRMPIIALTANAMKDDESRCLAAGMDDYVSKPVRRDRLALVLQRWLRTDSSSAA